MKGPCKLFFYIAALLCSWDRDYAQTTGVHKLKKQISIDPVAGNKLPDTACVNSLNQLARAYYGVNADSAFYFARKALEYAETTGFLKGQAESWRMIGNTYEMTGDYRQMLLSYHRSKSIALRIGNASQITKVNLNIALFYRQMGEYEAAISQIAKDSLMVGKGDDSTERAYYLSYLSDIALHKGYYDSALAQATQALHVAAALKDSLAYSSFNNDIGKVLAAMGQYKKAIPYHVKSLGFFRRSHDKLGETETVTLLAKAWLGAGKPATALTYATQGLALARQLNRKQELKESAECLAEIYKARHEYGAALNYFQLYKRYSDSLFIDHLDKELFAIESRYEFERREDSLQKDAQHQTLLRRQRDRHHQLQLLLFALIIVFLSVLVFILWRNKIAGRKYNELLLAKNQEIEQQKEAMEHQAVQLLLNNQEKDKLFSIIAHDLKGPLNSLKSLMDLLKEKKLPESEIRSMMAELSRNVGYSSELVNNLLFWASSQLHGITMKPVPIPMQKLMNEIISIFQRQADEKKIHVTNDIDPSVVAYADLDMTQVILRNLVSNAIKFCRIGDQIRIGSRKLDGIVEICIADTGIGIKEEILEKIRRKESVTTYGTAKEKGTGLGMLLCREFANANHGDFYVDSQWGKGSQFYLTMPVAANSSSISV